MANPAPIPTFPPPGLSDPCDELIPSYLNNGQHSNVFNVPNPPDLPKLFPCSQQPFFTSALYDDTEMLSRPNDTAVALMNRAYPPTCAPTTWCISARNPAITVESLKGDKAKNPGFTTLNGANGRTRWNAGTAMLSQMKQS
jgi:hypothetical protein